MNQDPASWDSTRWRDAAALCESQQQQQQQHTQHPQSQQHASSWPASATSQAHNHPSRPSAPQLSAPSAINPAAHSAILDHHSTHRSWIGKSREVTADPIPRLTEPYAATTDASTFHTGLYDQRHSPNYGPTLLPDASPRETSTGPWRSLHQGDRRMSSSHITDAPPLTLHIPQAHGMYIAFPVCPTYHMFPLYAAAAVLPYLQWWRNDRSAKDLAGHNDTPSREPD